MSNNKKVLAIVLIIAAFAVFDFAGCAKDATVTVNTPPAITKAVSFDNDIVPILNKSCNISGCHNAGGHMPDLTQANAYNSLVNGSYINAAYPENSELYLWLTGKMDASMPMGASNDPSSINELVLAWIKQGALKN